MLFFILTMYLYFQSKKVRVASFNNWISSFILGVGIILFLLMAVYYSENIVDYLFGFSGILFLLCAGRPTEGITEKGLLIRTQTYGLAGIFSKEILANEIRYWHYTYENGAIKCVIEPSEYTHGENYIIYFNVEDQNKLKNWFKNHRIPEIKDES